LKDSDPVLAYRSASAVEAHALVAHLENEGIESRVLGEPLQGAYAGIKLGGMDLLEVWVANKDRAAAEPVIAAWRAEHFPVGEKIKPRRFQFSLTLALLVMTYIALLAGAELMSEASRSVFMPLLTLLLLGGFVIVAWRRARARSAYPEED
jgi:hypothetical protein